MKVINRKISDLVPYDKNPRNNDNAVKFVAESIKQFGIQQPLVIDKENVIVVGHTRYKACKELGIDTVPCVLADELTADQVTAYRLVDNKTNEFANWSFDLLEDELAKLTDFDMPALGFTSNDIDWEDVDGLSKDTYQEPEKARLRCPSCGHIDDKEHFVKV